MKVRSNAIVPHRRPGLRRDDGLVPAWRRRVLRATQLALAAMLLLALLVSIASAQNTPPEQWEPDIAAFEAQDKTTPPTRGDIVFTGSSSIRMWTTLATDFPSLPVVNRGFGGSEIRDATRYAKRILARHKPRLVVMYAGDNDLMAGRTPRQVEKDFIAFVTRVRQDDPGVQVLYISIKPSPSRAQLLGAMRDANKRVARAASELKGVDFVDVFTPMLDTNGQPRAELFLDDQLHMNRDGYVLWTRLVAPYLR